MSDIVERLRTHCLDLEGGIRDEEILAAAGEITRLRSLLKEAGEALGNVPMPGGTTSWQGWKLAFLAWHEHTARTVLSKIKGEDALLKARKQGE